jgi:hypothetical protein
VPGIGDEGQAMRRQSPDDLSQHVAQGQCQGNSQTAAADAVLVSRSNYFVVVTLGCWMVK